MSGFDFEEFVARMLQQLGIGQIERVLFTQDEGRDILIRSPEGLIVVECKHQPTTSIGRPIVQKLHSAVVSSKAVKGLLVTTGRFTQEAIEHAKKLKAGGTTIEMIDRPILADMASRAGMKVISKGEALGVWTYSTPNEKQTMNALGSLVATYAESYPRSPLELLRDCSRVLTYRPMYLIRYSIDATFETTVGVIHREKTSDLTVAFDGNSGQLTRDDIVRFFEQEPQAPFSGTHPDFRGKLPTFQIDSTSLVRRAKRTIIKLHTKRVGYHGKNNVSYSKVCEPGERDIYVEDIRQVYLPLVKVSFTLATTSYQVAGAQAPSGRLLPISHDILTCKTCGQSISGRGLLCDTCGRVTHSGGFRLKSIHGFKCGRCQRTTCKVDGRWRNRFLIWRELMCPQCASKAKTMGQTIRSLQVVS